MNHVVLSELITVSLCDSVFSADKKYDCRRRERKKERGQSKGRSHNQDRLFVSWKRVKSYNPSVVVLVCSHSNQRHQRHIPTVTFQTSGSL